LYVHEHEVRATLRGDPKAVFRASSLDGLVTPRSQNVAHELEIFLVVFDDEHELHSDTGIVMVNVDPFPRALSRRRLPPCNSMMRLVNAKPRPVPSALLLESPPPCLNSSKTACWSSGAMPIPVSRTEISTLSVSLCACTSTRPP